MWEGWQEPTILGVVVALAYAVVQLALRRIDRRNGGGRDGISTALERLAVVSASLADTRADLRSLSASLRSVEISLTATRAQVTDLQTGVVTLLDWHRTQGDVVVSRRSAAEQGEVERLERRLREINERMARYVQRDFTQHDEPGRASA